MSLSFYFLETGSHYVAFAVLEHAMYNGLASTSHPPASAS